MSIKKLLFTTLFALSFYNTIAFGSDFQQRQTTIYPYQSTIEMQDDFIFGTSSSGNIGELGWNAAGTLSANVPVAGRPGVLRLDTSAISGTTARINAFGNSQYTPSMNLSTTFIFRLNTNDANTTVRHGSADIWAGAIARGVYFEKLDADTNWFCITRNAAVETRINSGIAINTSFNTYSIKANSTSVSFIINNALVCTNTTNIPTTEIGPGLQITNSAAASKTIDVDYFQILLTRLAR